MPQSNSTWAIASLQCESLQHSPLATLQERRTSKKIKGNPPKPAGPSFCCKWRKKLPQTFPLASRSSAGRRGELWARRPAPARGMRSPAGCRRGERELRGLGGCGDNNCCPPSTENAYCGSAGVSAEVATRLPEEMSRSQLNRAKRREEKLARLASKHCKVLW